MSRETWCEVPGLLYLPQSQRARGLENLQSSFECWVTVRERPACASGVKGATNAATIQLIPYVHDLGPEWNGRLRKVTIPSLFALIQMLQRATAMIGWSLMRGSLTARSSEEDDEIGGPRVPS